MEWVSRFYSKQHEWAHIFDGDITGIHRKNASVVERIAGGRTGLVLDLGAGGGQNAAALADLGYTVVAVELLASGARNARNLAALPRPGGITVIEGDFFEVELREDFDIVCYWDGFGTGSDEDQKRLLRRMAGWLLPTGFVLVEVYTPWYWASAAGRKMCRGGVIRRYDFDSEHGRMLDTWWPAGREEEAVTQSLRCYSPKELESLLGGTGFTLEAIESRGAYDPAQDRLIENVPVEESMQYLARLIPERR
jgi:SAM-dependent methyltransferase